MSRTNKNGSIDLLLALLFVIAATSYAMLALIQSESIQSREMNTLNGIHNFYPAETAARALLYETLGLDLKQAPPSSLQERTRANPFELLFAVESAYASPSNQTRSESSPKPEQAKKNETEKFLRKLKGPQGEVKEYCSVGSTPGIGQKRQLCIAVVPPSACTSPVTYKGGCWRVHPSGRMRPEGYSCNEVCENYGGPKDTLVTPTDCHWIADGFKNFGQINLTFAEIANRPVRGAPCFLTRCGRSSICVWFSTVVDQDARWMWPVCDCHR